MTHPIQSFQSPTGFSWHIFHDKSAESPRRSHDNLGTLQTWHRKYKLGDRHTLGFATPDEARRFILADGGVCLNVYLYDHGGLAVSTTPFGCQWDSGLLGVIYATAEAISKEDISLELATVILSGEIETLNSWLTGDVYCVLVKDTSKNIVARIGDIYGIKYAEELAADELAAATAGIELHI